MRYDYGTYSTHDRAASALEDGYSSGDICGGEFPRVERRCRKTASWSKAKDVFMLTLGDKEAA